MNNTATGNAAADADIPPGAHGRPVVTGLNRILVALLYLRQLFSQNVMCDLRGVTPL